MNYKNEPKLFMKYEQLEALFRKDKICVYNQQIRQLNDIPAEAGIQFIILDSLSSKECCFA